MVLKNRDLEIILLFKYNYYQFYFIFKVIHASLIANKRKTHYVIESNYLSAAIENNLPFNNTVI